MFTTMLDLPDNGGIQGECLWTWQQSKTAKFLNCACQYLFLPKCTYNQASRASQLELEEVGTIQYNNGSNLCSAPESRRKTK